MIIILVNLKTFKGYVNIVKHHLHKASSIYTKRTANNHDMT